MVVEFGPLIMKKTLLSINACLAFENPHDLLALRPRRSATVCRCISHSELRTINQSVNESMKQKVPLYPLNGSQNAKASLLRASLLAATHMWFDCPNHGTGT